MIKLYNDDCLEIMSKMPSESIDLVVTSPPYDNLRTYNNSLKWSFEIFQNIAKELVRVLRTGGVIVWVVSDATTNGSETGTSFKQALYFKELGLNIHDTMIWKKTTNTDTGSLRVRYGGIFEYMFIFSKGKPKIFNPIKDKQNKCFGDKKHGTVRQVDGTTKIISSIGKPIAEYGQRYNIWEITEEKNSKKYGHPAMFPLKLAQDHIITWSNEQDIILDPFMGSGTTGVACKKLNRNFIGIELEEKYFNIAEKRINEN